MTNIENTKKIIHNISVGFGHFGHFGHFKLSNWKSSAALDLLTS